MVNQIKILTSKKMLQYLSGHILLEIPCQTSEINLWPWFFYVKWRRFRILNFCKKKLFYYFFLVKLIFLKIINFILKGNPEIDFF